MNADAPDRSDHPQPAPPSLPDKERSGISDIVRGLRGLLGLSGDVGNDCSGQLTPQPTPGDSADGSAEPAKGRSLGERSPMVTPSDILRDPDRYAPPQQHQPQGAEWGLER